VTALGGLEGARGLRRWAGGCRCAVTASSCPAAAAWTSSRCSSTRSRPVSPPLVKEAHQGQAHGYTTPPQGRPQDDLWNADADHGDDADVAIACAPAALTATQQANKWAWPWALSPSSAGLSTASWAWVQRPPPRSTPSRRTRSDRPPEWAVAVMVMATVMTMLDHDDDYGHHCAPVSMVLTVLSGPAWRQLAIAASSPINPVPWSAAGQLHRRHRQRPADHRHLDQRATRPQ
jgi:hypothetical protein